jgi:hypothetical protein
MVSNRRLHSMNREQERLSLLSFTWSERGCKVKAVEDDTKAVIPPLKERYG